MEKYVCDCCGGTINPLTMTCEYCGTKYKREYDPRDDRSNIYRVETYQNPVRTYTARVDIDAYDVRTNDPETISQIAVKELARELSKCIAPNMVIESQRDIRYGGYSVFGTVKVVTPACGADKWRIDR